MYSLREGLLIKLKDPQNVYTSSQLALGISQLALPSDAGVSIRTPDTRTPGRCVGFWGRNVGPLICPASALVTESSPHIPKEAS